MSMPQGEFEISVKNDEWSSKDHTGDQPASGNGADNESPKTSE